MRVIMIGGYPGVGKSTIVRRMLGKLYEDGWRWEDRSVFTSVRYMYNPQLIVLGNYREEEPFPGTDRLPMNVQPKVQTFLDELRLKEPAPPARPITVLMEGDRLFNDKMITFLSGISELIICIVKANMKNVVTRRNARSQQDEAWRRGRQTKVDRIEMGHPIHHTLWNNTKEEQDKSIEELTLEVLGMWTGKPSQSKIKQLWTR